ncbi:MAG: efflux RND transporter permease subunit [Candidatus Delongbacteria bacterium]|nr:efflux RND transporter permease subunit [Candidatus Delongbacteria bacterium]
MRGIISGFIRYPIWSNVLMLVVFAAGLIFMLSMNSSVFPEIRPDTITIQVPFPGASPEEVEEGIVLRLEQTLEGLDGVERITSVANENLASLTVEVQKGSDKDRVLADIKNAIDQITALPEDAEKPVIFEQRFRGRAISIALYGPADHATLKDLAEDFRDRLLEQPGISQVVLEGLPEREISIEVSEESLRRYGLTFSQVAAAVSGGNVNLTGGKLDTRKEEYLIRALGRGYQVTDFLDLPVRGNTGGAVVRLEQVARVQERWEDNPKRVHHDGKPAVLVNVDKTISEDILEVAEICHEQVALFNDQGLPVQARAIDDRTLNLKDRLNLLIKNGLFGLTLVVICLWFFLNIHVSFWVALGVPFSFFGMFIIAGLVPITINVISLFGMIIVVGILVDDAIVVSENIFAHHERGAPPIKAAIEGTLEMIWPVLTSVSTTIIAFTPFFFLDGNLGKFIWQVALVVIACLAFSLIESFLILPAHLAHSKSLRKGATVNPVRRRVEGFIRYITVRLYSPLLKWALRNPMLTLCFPAAMLMVIFGMVRGGQVGLTFFPFIDGDNFPVNLTLSSGSQEVETERQLQRIEEAVAEVNRELSASRPDSQMVITGVTRTMGSNDLGGNGANAGKLNVLLLPTEQRNMDSYVIANRIRDRVGDVPGSRALTFGRVGTFGKPVSISLRSRDQAQLELARDILLEELHQVDDLKDITDSDQEGRRELVLSLKPQARSLGYTLRDVTSQVRQGYFGLQAQRLQRGQNELKVWVRYGEKERSSIGELQNMRITSPTGGIHRLGDLVTITWGKGITSIQHQDGQRLITLEASLNNESADLPPILQGIKETAFKAVAERTRGVTVSFEGQSRQQAKEAASIRRTFSIALAANFLLLVLVFRSWGQAGLIFSLIPLSLIGVVLGHWMHGIQLNMLSLYGIIALTGIIVNDGIVFVDQINRNLKSGMLLLDAIHGAGLSRLRPILLTTMTTTFGLGPLVLETSRQAQFLIPMAVSVAWGLLFGTVILLLVLPCGFLALNNVRQIWARLDGRTPPPEALEPSVLELETEELA